MEHKLIIATRIGTSEIFHQMFGREIKNLSTETVPIAKSVQQELSIVISFLGKLNGAFVFKCSKEFAVKLGSTMLGTEITPTDVTDAVGEVLNMITGATKKHYSDGVEDPYKVSIPTAVLGKDYVISLKANTSEMVTLFTFETEKFGNFYMELYITK